MTPLAWVGAITSLAALLIVSGAAVWATLAYIPAISDAATAPMTKVLWAGTMGAWAWGFMVGMMLVRIAWGARPLPYSRWDTRREREPTTTLGWTVSIGFAYSVGVFFANMAVRSALHLR